MSDISERLRGLLDKKKYKPRRLALECGISESVISRILNHNTNPQPDNLQKLADFFHVSPDWLSLGIDENMSSEEPYIPYYSNPTFILDGVEYKRLTNEEKVDVLLAQNSRLMGMLETQISSVNILSRTIDTGSPLKNVSGAAISK